MTRFLRHAFLLFFLSFIVGCGEDVCVLGIGDCDEISGELTIAADSSSVTVGQALVFTASGGTPPYSFAIQTGSGSLSQGSESTATLTPNETGVFCVRLTDSTSKQDDICVSSVSTSS